MVPTGSEWRAGRASRAQMQRSLSSPSLWRDRWKDRLWGRRHRCCWSSSAGWWMAACRPRSTSHRHRRYCWGCWPPYVPSPLPPRPTSRRIPNLRPKTSCRRRGRWPNWNGDDSTIHLASCARVPSLRGTPSRRSSRSTGSGCSSCRRWKRRTTSSHRGPLAGAASWCCWWVPSGRGMFPGLRCHEASERKASGLASGLPGTGTLHWRASRPRPESSSWRGGTSRTCFRRPRRRCCCGSRC